MDKDARVEETVDLRTNVELVRSVSDKHHDLLRPSARNYSRGQATDAGGRGKGKYVLIRDPEDFQNGIYDKPLPFYGCGIGWFSFLFGFLCPPMWFYATILYFGNHYRKDPRERAGLGASAIAVISLPLYSFCPFVCLFLHAVAYVNNNVVHWNEVFCHIALEQAKTNKKPIETPVYLDQTLFLKLNYRSEVKFIPYFEDVFQCTGISSNSSKYHFIEYFCNKCHNQ